MGSQQLATGRGRPPLFQEVPHSAHSLCGRRGAPPVMIRGGTMDRLCGTGGLGIAGAAPGAVAVPTPAASEQAVMSAGIGGRVLP